MPQLPQRAALAAALAAAVVAAALGLAAQPARAEGSSPFETKIAVEAAIPVKVDFFSPKVFEHRYYVAHNNLTKVAPTSREARAHWSSKGLKAGLRASPLFWSRAYLEHNVDVRDLYGADNYPMAVLHYLTRGVNETWRETGGPRRASIFDERVFRWQWYARHNPGLALRSEDDAKEHWRATGLDKGLQASPDVHLKAYLERNSDLRARFGPTNYAAALAYFLDRGVKETWRPNGGQTCRFWGQWCQRGLVNALARGRGPEPPRYNSSGLPYDPGFQAPIPQAAGWDVTVNGVDCADLRERTDPRPSHSRVETVYHMHFRGLAGQMRPCNVYVRHYVDLQTRTQDSSPEALSLRHWHFDDAVPPAALRRPANLSHVTYEGFSYYQKPASRPGARGTVDPSLVRHAVNYTVSGFLMVDPSVDSGDGQKKADREALPPRTMWSVQHHYKPDPSAPAGSSGPWGPYGANELDEEAARARHARMNTFFQPAHTPYRNAPLPANYYVSSGVIPYFEKNAHERAAVQRRRSEAKMLEATLNTDSAQ